MRVLITGASGFIGQHLVSQLVRRDYYVYAASRSLPDSVRSTADDSVLIADLFDEAAWMSALKEVDAVIHLASRVHVMEDETQEGIAEFSRINVDGTRAVLDCCRRSDVRHFIFLSTIKVKGEQTSGLPFHPDGILDPQDPYSRSKLAAESVVREGCAAGNIDWTIIRPPLVYGPGVKANFARLVRFVQSGWPIPFGSCNNRRSMVYVENLCDLIACALVDRQARNQVLHVSDGQDLAISELIRIIAEASGRPCRIFPFPPSLLAGLGHFLGAKKQVERLTSSLEVDISETTRLLDWRPPVPVDEAIRRSIDG